MKRAVENVEFNLLMLQGQIFSACRMGAWCFNAEKKLYYSTAPHQEEYHDLLEKGGALQLAVGLKDREGIPHVISGNMGLAWIAEWVHLKKGGGFLVVLGPAYLRNRSVEQSLQKLEQKGISQELRRLYMNVLNDVPVLSVDMLRQYACILHYTCYEEAVNPVTVAPEPSRPSRSERESEESQPDSNDYQRMAAYEDMLLHHLSKGTEIPKGDASYVGELQNYGIKDPLREIKDNLIIFTGLCARTAVKSGVPVYTSRTMENEWVSRIEAARGFLEAKRLRESMYNAFMRQVRQYQEGAGYSRAVRECRSYIQANYMNDLPLEDIARRCGYADYYLSRKFSKETGMKISEYIHSVRIDAAKIMLITTTREIQDISDYLRFGNRSHFDRVFRQFVGISPARFREQGGQFTAAGESEE